MTRPKDKLKGKKMKRRKENAAVNFRRALRGESGPVTIIQATPEEIAERLKR